MVPPACYPNAFNETFVWNWNSGRFGDGDDDITELDSETRSAPEQSAPEQSVPEQSSFSTTSQTAPSNQTSSLPVITGIEDQARTDNLPSSTELGSSQTLNQTELPETETAKQTEVDHQTGYINEHEIRVQFNPYDTVYTRSSKRKRPAPAEVSADVSNEDNIQAQETSVSAITVTPSQVCLGLFL